MFLPQFNIITFDNLKMNKKLAAFKFPTVMFKVNHIPYKNYFF